MKNVLLLCLISLSILAYGQYTPLLNPNNVWESSYGYSVEYGLYYHMMLSEETQLVNGQEYYSFQYIGTYPESNSYEDGFLLRENIDEKKVFILDENNEEVLLYDFNLEIGDTVPVSGFEPFGMYTFPDPLIVSDITFETIFGIPDVKVFHTEGVNGVTHLKIYEGIGTNDGLYSIAHLEYPRNLHGFQRMETPHPPYRIMYESQWYLTELTVGGESIFIPNNEEIPYIDLDIRFEELGQCIILETKALTTTEFCSDIDYSSGSLSLWSFVLNISPPIGTATIAVNQYFENKYFNEFWQVNNEDLMDYDIEVIEGEGDEYDTLILTKENGDVAIYGNANLSLDDFDPKPVISMYPNPFSDQLLIENSKAYGISKIQVYDSKGMYLDSFDLKEDKENIDLSHLPSGVYIISLYDAYNRLVESKKVIKK